MGNRKQKKLKCTGREEITKEDIQWQKVYEKMLKRSLIIREKQIKTASVRIAFIKKTRV